MGGTRDYWGGSLWEAGEGRAGDGILKGAGSKRNRKEILQHCTIFFAI